MTIYDTAKVVQGFSEMCHTQASPKEKHQSLKECAEVIVFIDCRFLVFIINANVTKDLKKQIIMNNYK